MTTMPSPAPAIPRAGEGARIGKRCDSGLPLRCLRFRCPVAARPAFPLPVLGRHPWQPVRGATYTFVSQTSCADASCDTSGLSAPCHDFTLRLHGVLIVDRVSSTLDTRSTVLELTAEGAGNRLRPPTIRAPNSLQVR